MALGQPGLALGCAAKRWIDALLDIDASNTYLLLAPLAAPEESLPQAPNLLVHRVDSPLDAPFPDGLKLPEPADLLYTPSYLLPRLTGAKSEVVCVHDAGWNPKSAYWSWAAPRMKEALHRTRGVHCLSRSTRDLLRERGRIPGRARTLAIPPGIDPRRFYPETEPAEDEGAPYIAVVGNQEPQATRSAAADVFPRLRIRMRPCRLVPVGPEERARSRTAAIDFFGDLDTGQLAALFRGALLVVQPSLFEASGPTLLEAMACGIPAACADQPIFHELAGRGASYFDPRDARSIAKCMERLALDPDLRAAACARALEQAARFDWKDSATRLLELFEEAAS